MKSKSMLLSTLLAFVLTLTLFGPLASPTEDGVAQYLLEHVYIRPDHANGGLEAGDIDMIDWPLSKEWIDRWATNPDITMMSYAEIGINILDMNNQRWPTGVTMPRVFDTATGTYKHYYDDGGTPGVVDTWDDVAAEFRKAICHLTDKDAIIRDVVEGYGYKMETAIPVPALGGYTDYGDLQAKGLIYDYDPYTANARLDDAGFTQGSTPNPYYPASPEGWEAMYLREDPQYGGDLQPLEFYIRLDDPEQNATGKMIRDALRKAGIPVNAHIVEKSACYEAVMVEYDYHLYTGGRQLSADVDFLYWLWASEMYFGGSATSYYGGVGWSLNYEGFCTPEFDAQALAILTATTAAQVKTAALIAQEVMQKYCHSCPLWCSAAFKAYRSGWDGVVNIEGYGVNNAWSFMNMYQADDNWIDYGLSSNLEDPQVITAQWYWDTQVIDYVYDPLIGLNPYNFAEDIGFLAESWETGLWSGGMWCKFTLVDGATFHDGSPVTAYDVAFSEIFPRDCGSGVCSYISNVLSTDHVEIQSIPSSVPSHPDIAANSALAADEIVVYLNIVNYFGLHWTGGVPILNSAMWLAANSHYGWQWPSTTFDTTNRYLVRDYHPWEHDVYNAASGGVGSDGTYDFCQDGAGAWMYHSTDSPTAISASTWVLLERYAGYYMTNTEIAGKINYWFHLIGNVNYPGSVHEAEYIAKGVGIDECISIIDAAFLFMSWGTTPVWPHGTGWLEWNEDCDFDSSNMIDPSDLYRLAYSWGRDLKWIPPVREPPDPGVKIKVKPDPTQQSVTVGSEFTINVTIEEVTELWLYELRVHWDSTSMKATGLDNGDFFVDPWLYLCRSHSVNELYICCLSRQAVSGSGVLCTIHFECTGTTNPPITTIHIGSELYDYNLVYIPHFHFDARVNQKSPKS